MRSKTMSKSYSRANGRPETDRRARKTGLGALPEWNLADLYSGLDDPAIKRDLDRADAECVAFENAYKGKLADMARSATAGAALAEAVRRYEAIDDLDGTARLLCRTVACRQYGRSAAHQILRRRAGAADRGLDAPLVLLARAQPHRRCADRSGDERSGARPLSAVDRGRAPLPALSAGRPRRAAVPRKIDDRLFGAWNRQFDATIANLRFKVRRQVAGDRADAQSAAGPLAAKSARPPRRRWRRHSRTMCSSSR